MSAAPSSLTIINVATTKHAAEWRFRYHALFIPSGVSSEREIAVILNDGPDIGVRAREAACVVVNDWNRCGGRRWLYWIE